MIDQSMYQISPERFARFEVGARSLVSTMERGDDLDLEALTKSLGGTLEYMLCDLFRQVEATSRYWCDGVDIRGVERMPDNGVRVKGRAWCADHGDQWQVPVEVLFGFSDGPCFAVSSLTVRIGDAAFASLGDHRTRWPRRTAESEAWLHELVVQCPAAPAPLDARSVEARLCEWMESNPSRPVVGPDWQTLDREVAAHYIRSRYAENCPVTLEETWLDHGPALIIQ